MDPVTIMDAYNDRDMRITIMDAYNDHAYNAFSRKLSHASLIVIRIHDRYRLLKHFNPARNNKKNLSSYKNNTSTQRRSGSWKPDTKRVRFPNDGDQEYYV